MTILGWDVFRASIAALALSPLFPAVAPGIATADTQLIENCPKVTETGGDPERHRDGVPHQRQL